MALPIYRIFAFSIEDMGYLCLLQKSHPFLPPRRGRALRLGLTLGGDLVPRALALRGRGLPAVRGGLALRSPVLGDLMLVLHDLLAHRPLLRRGLATQLGVPGAGPAGVGPAVRAPALLGGGVEGGDVEQRGAHERVAERGADRKSTV